LCIAFLLSIVFSSKYAAVEKNEHIKSLFTKYVDGQYTKEDLDEILTYLEQEEESALLIELVQKQLSKFEPEEDSERITRIQNRVAEHLEVYTKPKTSFKIYWIATAASILLLAFTSYYFLQIRTTVLPGTDTFAASDSLQEVSAGSNRATLTLSDGTTLNLSDQKEGISMGENINYNDGVSIAEKPTGTATLTTPRGGQYQVVLSDGTKIWLNADSYIRYPVKFGGDSRNVEIEGEAYLEVAKVKGQPFRVNSKGQAIEVLGTHFNVRTYDNQKQTTLIEGSVRITDGKSMTLLRPNQQAKLYGGKIQIKEVDAEESIAWTKNTLYFNELPLMEVFRQLERWYDVEFDYPAELGNQVIYLSTTRDQNLSVVLHNLKEITEYTYTTKGRRVIVSRVDK
jgi:ferric-dicitrate binding protein FerR (iron transport regulator)